MRSASPQQPFALEPLDRPVRSGGRDPDSDSVSIGNEDVFAVARQLMPALQIRSILRRRHLGRHRFILVLYNIAESSVQIVRLLPGGRPRHGGPSNVWGSSRPTPLVDASRPRSNSANIPSVVATRVTSSFHVAQIEGHENHQAMS